MYRIHVKQINESIKRTKKAIISIGCSFVQGQGAVNDTLYTEYKWKFEDLGVPITIDEQYADYNEVVEKYPDVVIKNGKLDFRFMEYKNAFVNVLCNKFFNGEYTPINLGIAGCGNRASIKELYFYPEINWHEIEEFIVVYCPSGPERFDFVNDQWAEHGHWVCMWPHYKDKEDSARKLLWKGYSDALYSDKFEVIEQIAHVQELMLWCKQHNNAKLIITPGFDQRYNKKYFEKSLFRGISRAITGETLEDNHINGKEELQGLQNLLQLWPWDCMFDPNGYKTFADAVVAKENSKKGKDDHFFNYLGTGSPNGWITACAHPSAKGHEYFAHLLHQHITNGMR